jgi:hypothetical protein
LNPQVTTADVSVLVLCFEINKSEETAHRTTGILEYSGLFRNPSVQTAAIGAVRKYGERP